jgi:phospholipase/carboxylesterase
MNRQQAPSGKDQASIPSSQLPHGLLDDGQPLNINPLGPLSAEFGRVSTRTATAPQAVFSPLHYESGYAYPLFVWLHGPGDDEHQLRRIMPLVSLRNYVAVAPRGTDVAEGPDAKGLAWRQAEEEIEEAADRVFDGVAFTINRFHIAPTRVFLAGYQSGGTMAVRLALHYPHRFAGAVSIGGPFPRGLRPLRRIESVRSLPLLLATARESRLYPEWCVCRDLQLAHTAGLSVDMRQYSCGDELTTTMLEDVDKWIMQQICPASASTERD